MTGGSGTGAPERRRIVVAMSGGVDSSVAAALLRDQGHEVIGVTLKLQACDETGTSGSCCGPDAIARARAVAGQLGMAHYVVDSVSEFDEQVLRPAWDEYAGGKTPSPCLWCNERIKFGSLLAWARRLDATMLATGHYARIECSPAGEPSLLRGVDADKDQSYFLAGLTRAQLVALLFPIGHLTKPAVRELASSLGLASAETHDSQDACLVGPGQSYAEMLRARFSAASQPGNIVDEDGQVLGQHPGIHNFTVGQRRGVHVPSTQRLWVKAVRATDAAIVVTADPNALSADGFVATGVNWIGKDPCADGREASCEVQVRYRHVAEPARLLPAGASDTVHVVLGRPVRAITPGQAAVFYDGARVLGRGWIRTD